MGNECNREEAVFDKAIKIKSASSRTAFVKSACGDDTELLVRVNALLKVHYEDKSFLKAPALGLGVTLDDPPLTEGPGTKIGRYKLLEQIGEGGFGVVYMAEQEKPIRRRVALKIIKLGMDTKQVIARFEAERQALALMDHSNIAKVLDAGATDTGRPYFVMELVKGVPITEYCDSNTITTEERLKLFIDVCKAVQHAHQKGIIHRDIKPTNVMITLRDGVPVPKVIDFGIAKATQHRLTEKTLFTEYRQFIGTPEYMSPEQAEMSELDVDTRSDIYSLGVLLYELLTGTTPFDAKELRSAAFDEIVRIIRETEPPRPSTRLSTLGDTLTDVARHRHAEPKQLCKIVRGDLDWIVMRTLEKDRTRRYETANELARDIERYMNDEPVIAGPPGTVYRIKKFVRRNRTAVVAGLLVAAVLVFGLCLATVGFVQASRQRDLAQEQRRRANVNFSMARDAVEEMTRTAKEELARFPETEQIRRTLLEKVKVFYEGFLEENSDDPAAIGQIGLAYDQIGDIHSAFGQYKQSVQALRDATEVFKKLAASSVDAARWQEELAWSNQHMAWVLRIIGQNEEAESACHNAIAIWENMVNESPNVSAYQNGLGQCYVTLGNVLEQGNRLDEAVEAYREARRIMGKLAADFPDRLGHHVWLYWNCWMIRVVLTKTNRLAEAEEHYRQAVLAHEELLADFPDVWRHCWGLAYAKNELGLVLQGSGQLEEAEENILQAVKLFENLVSDFPNVVSHRYSLGHTLRGLGGILQEAGKFEESEQAHRRAIAVYEELMADVPNIHFETALGNCYDGLGLLLSESGRNEEAKGVYLRALAIKGELVAREPGKEDMVRGSFETRFRLVKVLRDTGQLEEAEAIARQSVEELERWVADFPGSIGYREDLAKALRNLSGLLEATQAREITNWKDHGYLNTLAAAYSESGDFEKAIKWQKEAINNIPQNMSSKWKDTYEYCLGLYEAKQPHHTGHLWSFSNGQLIACWDFEQSEEGIVVDTSGNGLKGKLIGGAKIVVDPERGKVLDVDGDGEYVDCGDSWLFDISGSITVSAWINAGSWTKEVWRGYIVSKDDWERGINGYSLRCGDDGRLSFVLGIGIPNGWPETVSAPNSMVINKWYHVAGTYDGKSIRVYINGILSGSTEQTGTINLSNYDLNIGRGTFAHAHDRLFDGLIDDVRIYSYALSQAEIAALAAESNPELPTVGKEQEEKE